MKIIRLGVISWDTLKVEHEESFEYEGPVAQCGGMLGFAAAGAVSGLGQGLADIGRESMREMRDAKIQQLQQEFAQKQQANEFTHQGEMQSTGIQARKDIETQRETYETGAKKTEYEIAAKSATAHNEFTRTLKQLEIQGRHKDIADLVAGRITVAEINARRSADAAGKAPGEFKAGKGTLNSPGLDAIDHPIPGKQVDVQIHRDGSKWIQGPAGAFYPFDPSRPTGYADPKSFRNPSAADTSALLQNPLGKLPSGISIRDYYVNKFGRLPNGYLAAAEGARAQISASQTQPSVPKASPSNQPTAGDVSDAQDEQQDNDYAMFGDRGHQPDDDEPAQE